MAVRITCPHCQRDLRLPEDLYRQPAQCPCCQGAFTARWKRRRPAPVSTPVVATPPEEQKRCRFCGEWIKKQARRCRFCGEIVAGGQ